MNEEVKEVEPTQQTSQEPVKQQAESDFERNFRAVRERLEAAERRNYELEQRMSQQAQPKDKEDIDDDDYMTGKYYKKTKSELQEMKSTLEANIKAMEEFRMQVAEQHLRSKYSDIEDVVNKENLEKLSKIKPALYKTIINHKDVKDQGEAAYDAIKEFVHKNMNDAEKKLAENKNKIRSVSTVATPSSDPSEPLARIGDYDRRGMTSERKVKTMELLKQVRSRL